jgi:hypothetical protein
LERRLGEAEAPLRRRQLDLEDEGLGLATARIKQQRAWDDEWYSGIGEILKRYSPSPPRLGGLQRLPAPLPHLW